MGKWIVGFILASGLFLVFMMLSYTGAFKDVTIETKELGPFYLYAQPHRGAYHKIVKQLEALEKLAAQEGISCLTTFGRFYDNPESVDEDRLKSDVGCLYEQQKPQLTETFLKEVTEQQIPAQLFVEGTFDGAPSIGPFKAYPKIKEYILEKGLVETGAPIEIYELSEQKGIRTRYLFPVKK